MYQRKPFPGRSQRSERTRRMVVAAMLGAITAVMIFTPIGMIPLPPPLPAVTMAHIPVILAVLAESLSVGLSVGLVFGLCSLIRAWQSGAVGLTLFFRNPLVSVLPRLMIPLVVFLVFRLWQRLPVKNTLAGKLGAAVAAVSGALTNTLACLGMLLLIYGRELGELVSRLAASGGADAAFAGNAGGWLFTAVGLPNGLAEAAVAAILAPVLQAAALAVGKRPGRRGRQ